MVGLDDLRKVLLSERETGKLLQITPDFFDRARTTLQALRQKVEGSEDPFSDEVQKMILETRSISETLFDLFAIRTSKILSLAEGLAQGHYIDREEVRKMIPPEHEMFDRITAAIGSCQGVLVQNTPQTHLPVQEDAIPVAAQEAAVAVPAEPSRNQSAPPATPPYALVRVLADMDAFMGVDGKTYTLEKGDLVMLPERNAEVLVERNIALNMNVCK